MHTADYWIELLQLKPHPEGGYYREMYRADETMAPEALPNRYQNQAHVYSTAIYFLLKAGEPSKFHRLQSDELWHYYAGSSVTIHLIDERGEHLQKVLGPDYEKGQAFMQVIPRQQWFGAAVNSVVEDTSAEENPRGYVLIGCTVAPGFEFGDFELGHRSELLAQYPQYASLIHELT